MDLDTFLKILGAVGGVAGLSFLWSQWTERRRISAHIINETYGPKESSCPELSLELEVTNLGGKPTALNENIPIKALTLKGETIKFDLTVEESDRELPSNSPRQFVAKGKVEAAFPFSWFRRYKISVTRGKGIKILHRNAFGKDLGAFGYWREYILFKLFGRVTEEK